MISVNRSELGNTVDFNFAASTLNLSDRTSDYGPNDGAYNYSLDVNGPQINSVDVKTTPSVGPRAGKRFVVVPTGLKLPPDGRAIATAGSARRATRASQSSVRSSLPAAVPAAAPSPSRRRRLAASG